MQNKSKLTKKQLAVIDAVFTSDEDETDILEKHRVGLSQYNKWLADENFKAEFARRIEWLNLKSQALIARYTSLAAAKLIELTESGKEETRRRACLDILSLPKQLPQVQSADANPENTPPLPPQTASKLLAALAEK